MGVLLDQNQLILQQEQSAQLVDTVSKVEQLNHSVQLVTSVFIRVLMILLLVSNVKPVITVKELVAVQHQHNFVQLVLSVLKALLTT